MHFADLLLAAQRGPVVHRVTRINLQGKCPKNLEHIDIQYNHQKLCYIYIMLYYSPIGRSSQIFKMISFQELKI